MKKHLFYACAIAMAAVVLTGCKSKESQFKAVYDQAQADRETAATTVPPTQQVSPVEVTPVTPVQPATVTTTPIVSDESVKQENVKLINGSGLKAYSVVVGSYGVQANAERQQADLKKAGYDAQVVYNPEKNMYRVIATTFNDRASAVQSRDALRTSVNTGAWLLYAK